MVGSGAGVMPPAASNCPCGFPASRAALTEIGVVETEILLRVKYSARFENGRFGRLPASDQAEGVVWQRLKQRVRFKWKNAEKISKEPRVLTPVATSVSILALALPVLPMATTLALPDARSRTSPAPGVNAGSIVLSNGTLVRVFVAMGRHASTST
jgi:hypothetical protein